MQLLLSLELHAPNCWKPVFFQLPPFFGRVENPTIGNKIVTVHKLLWGN